MKKRPWPILISAAVLAAVTIAYAMNQETPDKQYQVGLLTSVRLSAIYFLTTFTISPLFRLTSSPWLKPIVINRRYLGLSFALLHSVHLGFITLWVRANPDKVDPIVLVSGGIAYLFMYLQVATSNDYSMTKLRHYWRWLHNFSTYFLWLVITFTFSGSDSLTARIYAIALVLAMIIRLGATWKASRDQ